jgi:hypothetical protein
MRTFVISLVLAATGTVSAEVIHLKNGDVVYADQVKETADTVEYEVGDNSYTIPRSKVQSIEAGTAPTAGNRQVEAPAFTPQAPVPDEVGPLKEIVHGNEVDRGVLSEIESRGDAHETAAAYYIAAKTEFEAGKFADARHDLEVALHYDPQDPALLTYYAAVLVRTGNAMDAVIYAEQAIQIAPDSPDAYAVLGYAQYSQSHLRDCIQSFKQSLALRPDRSIQQLLAKAERESGAESNYSERETGHFVLRYEGKQSSESFRSQLLASLESDYQNLAHEFGSEPRSSIEVVLYTNQAFFDVTRAPSWTGALNDGKLRIPLQGLDSITPELARVLRHELTHSFVNQLSMGRCPQWLNEGMAQMFEPRSLGSSGVPLAQMYAGGKEMPLSMLEYGFFSFNGAQALVAYDESLAATLYIRDRYGMSDLMRLLALIGKGESTETAMRAVLHSDYAHLEEDLRNALTSGGN